MVLRLRGGGDRRQRAAVEAVLEGDDLVAPGGVARRASLSAPSLASAPELQKKHLPPKERSEMIFARSALRLHVEVVRDVQQLPACSPNAADRRADGNGPVAVPTPQPGKTIEELTFRAGHGCTASLHASSPTDEQTSLQMTHIWRKRPVKPALPGRDYGARRLWRVGKRCVSSDPSYHLRKLRSLRIPFHPRRTTEGRPGRNG